MTAILTLAVAAAGTFALGLFTAITPWWRSRAGRAYFSLFASLVALGWHFILEALLGQAPAWVEDGLLLVILAAVIFNAHTAMRKQVRGWRARRTPQT